MDAASHPLRRLLEPRSVVVLGASEAPKKYGHILLRTLIEEGYPGAVYAVNPNGGSLLGRPFLRSLDEVEGEIDVALVVRPARECPAAVCELARRGVAYAVVYAAGFAELGPQGERLQRELVAAAGSGTRVVGPNGMNVFSAPARFNLSAIVPFPAGALGFLSASGNLGYALAQEASRRGGPGFSRFISVGNQADLALDEYLDFLRVDPATRVVLVYLEGFVRGRARAFLDVLARTAAAKPVLVLRGGRTRPGRTTAHSHTAALAGEAEVARAALEQAGAVLVERADELLALAEAFLVSPLPAGPRAALVGEGGGHATLLADASAEAGLGLERLPEALVEALRPHLPPFATIVRNPVEMGGVSEHDPRVYEKVLEPIFEWPDADLVLLFGGYALYDERLAEFLASRRKQTGKPVLLHDLYAGEPREAFAPLRARGLPLYASGDVMVRAAAALARGAEARRRATRACPAAPPAAALPPDLRAALERARRRASRALSEDEAARLLAHFGVPVPPAALASSAGAAVAAAEGLGYPVVLKLHHPEVVHKSDVGGVHLDLRSATEVRRAYEALRRLGHAAELEVRLTPHRRGGVELIAGARHDAIYGPILLLGAGGVLAESTRDAAIRTLPCPVEELEGMLDEPAVAPRLAGGRGRARVAHGPLVAALAALATAFLALPELSDLEVNPLLGSEDGVVALDARGLLVP